MPFCDGKPVLRQGSIHFLTGVKANQHASSHSEMHGRFGIHYGRTAAVPHRDITTAVWQLAYKKVGQRSMGSARGLHVHYPQPLRI
jgi:hypothetical protein